MVMMNKNLIYSRSQLNMTFNLAENLNEDAETLGVKPSLEEAIEKAEIKDLPDLLKRIAEEPQTEVERAIYIDKLSKKVSVSKNTVRKDLKPLMMPIPAGQECKVEKSALFKGLVDLVVDDDDQVAYLIKDGNELVMTKAHNAKDDLLQVPPAKEHLPFMLVRGKEVMKWYKNDDHHKLFEDINSYYKRFSYTTDDQFLILACFAFVTYLQDHKDIYYLPTIYSYAGPEHGKSRTGKSMTYICYRGIHTVDLREPNIFRYSERLQATMFFDIMNLWKQIERSNSQDIMLLRNEKGAKTSRVTNPEKGKFEDMNNYEIFGATIVASNKDVDAILGSRCIPIEMPNRPGYYENLSPDKAVDIKARLIAWRAHYMDQPLHEIDVVPEITGRAWDISKPLLQICKMVCPQRYDELVETLTSIAKMKKAEKSESFEAKVISIIGRQFIALKDTGLPDPISIGTARVLEQVNAGLKEDFKMTSQGLGRKLKSIGIKTTIVGGYSKIQIDEEALGKLMELYGLGVENHDEDTVDVA